MRSVTGSLTRHVYRDFMKSASKANKGNHDDTVLSLLYGPSAAAEYTDEPHESSGIQVKLGFLGVGTPTVAATETGSRPSASQASLGTTRRRRRQEWIDTVINARFVARAERRNAAATASISATAAPVATQDEAPIAAPVATQDEAQIVTTKPTITKAVPTTTDRRRPKRAKAGTTKATPSEDTLTKATHAVTKAEGRTETADKTSAIKKQRPRKKWRRWARTRWGRTTAEKSDIARASAKWRKIAGIRTPLKIQRVTKGDGSAIALDAILGLEISQSVAALGLPQVETAAAKSHSADVTATESGG
ncbi:hypothetical protein B0H12DRAFT_618662 [Mycena haematopus]|nr:hypothetical protein B0H12DRAFT_618662 [Mycena haematopus]